MSDPAGYDFGGSDYPDDHPIHKARTVDGRLETPLEMATRYRRETVERLQDREADNEKEIAERRSRELSHMATWPEPDGPETRGNLGEASAALLERLKGLADTPDDPLLAECRLLYRYEQWRNPALPAHSGFDLHKKRILDFVTRLHGVDLPAWGDTWLSGGPS